VFGVEDWLRIIVNGLFVIEFVEDLESVLRLLTECKVLKFC
jgi:hypothetical protein